MNALSMETRKICQINEKAIYLLQEGSYSEAEYLLSDGLFWSESLHSKFQSQSQSSQHDDDDDDDDDDDARVVEKQCCFDSIPLEEIFGHGMLSPSSPNTFFPFFQQAIYLDSEEYHACDTWALTAMIAYNLGLFHHVTAFAEGTLPELSKSRSYYLLALAYLNNDPQDNKASLLSMAIYNNLGHLSWFLGDRETVMRCREVMEIDFYSASHVNNATWTEHFGHSICGSWGVTLALAPAA